MNADAQPATLCAHVGFLLLRYRPRYADASPIEPRSPCVPVGSLGEDRNGATYFLFGSDMSRLFVERDVDGGADGDGNKRRREWVLYDTPESIDKVLAWLNPNGARERHLAKALASAWSKLVGAMRRRTSAIAVPPTLAAVGVRAIGHNPTPQLQNDCGACSSRIVRDAQHCPVCHVTLSTCLCEFALCIALHCSPFPCPPAHAHTRAQPGFLQPSLRFNSIFCAAFDVMP